MRKMSHRKISNLAKIIQLASGTYVLNQLIVGWQLRECRVRFLVLLTSDSPVRINGGNSCHFFVSP